MSQFIVLLKRHPEAPPKTSSMDALPPASILELTEDACSYLWPVTRQIDDPCRLNPLDPTDSEILLNGQWIADGGFYRYVSDYLDINQLPENSFYLIHLGELADVSEARSVLQLLKAQL